MKEFEYKVILYSSIPEIGFSVDYSPEGIEQARQSCENWLNEQGKDGWEVRRGERAYVLMREKKDRPSPQRRIIPVDEMAPEMIERMRCEADAIAEYLVNHPEKREVFNPPYQGDEEDED